VDTDTSGQQRLESFEMWIWIKMHAAEDSKGWRYSGKMSDTWFTA